MGFEIAIALGARAALGRILDAECALACAHRAMACPWLFQPESTRSALLRFNGAFLDWSPVIQHLSRVLHGSVPTASSSTADPVRIAPASRDRGMLCSISPSGLGAAMDARGATYWTGDYRLCLRDISLRSAAFRCPFTLPFARGARLVHSDQTPGSFLRADCRRRARFCGGYPRRGGRLSGSLDRSLVFRHSDCVSAGWNPRRRNPGAVYRDSSNVVCRGACAAVVIATRVVHCWNRGYGWPRSSSSEIVSLPGALDLAALDSGFGSGIANIVCGGRSNARHCAPSSA